MFNILAFDVGGTKIAGGLFTPDLRLIAQRVVPTPKDYADFVAVCASMALELLAAGGGGIAPQIGFGIAGWIDQRSGGVRAPNLHHLADKPLRDDLSQQLNGAVQLANDANCSALAEAYDGAGQGFTTVLGLILGTGVGAGYIVNGRIIQGPNGLAGEIGHLPLPFRTAEDGDPMTCGCGQQGCIEQSINGAALTRLCLAQTGKAAVPPEIAEAARRGESWALDVLGTYYETVAKALVTIIHSFDPDAIVVSGGLSNLPGLCEQVTARWGRYCFNPHPATRLVLAQHGPMAGLRGAAIMAATEAKAEIQFQQLGAVARQ